MRNSFKTHSIEWLYAKLDKQILLAKSYTEIEELEFIIKACRLKPYEYMIKKNDNLILHRWWCDEFNNSLKIVNKTIKIVFNDLNINKEKVNYCTDLYYGLTLENVVKISKLVYIVYGKDDDLYQDCFLISFLGIDNYLRSYLYLYGEWQQVSSLLLGEKHLKNIYQNLDEKYFKKNELKNNLPIPCIVGNSYLLCLPAAPEFIENINKECETIGNILK